MAASEPSKDHQGQASVLLHANHWQQKNLFEDTKVPLTAKSSSWPWRLQEQAQGASGQAPSWRGAQSVCWQRPHQLNDVNKAEAARQVKASNKPTSIPKLGRCLPRLPFLVGAAVPTRRLNFFCSQRWMGPRETTRKNKILFYWTSTYVVGNTPLADVLRIKSKWIILLIAWNAIGQEILANFVVR